MIDKIGVYLGACRAWHTYFTNVMINFSNIPQQQDFVNGGKRINNDGYNQGGQNVFNCIDYWITYVFANYF